MLSGCQLICNIFLTHWGIPIPRAGYGVLLFLEYPMKTIALLVLVCGLMVIATSGIFSLLTAVQTAVPGASASPTLVAGIFLMLASFSSMTTLNIARRFD
jgi:hypothetical protein